MQDSTNSISKSLKHANESNSGLGNVVVNNFYFSAATLYDDYDSNKNNNSKNDIYTNLSLSRNNCKKDSKNYSLTSKWIRRTSLSDTLNDIDLNDKNFKNNKSQSDPYYQINSKSLDTISSSQEKLINKSAQSKENTSFNSLDNLEEEYESNSSSKKSNRRVSAVYNFSNTDYGNLSSITPVPMTRTSLSQSTMDSYSSSNSSSTSTSSSCSLSMSSTSSTSSSSCTLPNNSNESQTYYQRSSGGFNFAHMLYDIPEEEDGDEVTENDASNIDGVLRI